HEVSDRRDHAGSSRPTRESTGHAAGGAPVTFDVGRRAMRLRDRYARLSFWNKLGVWGAAASLVGLTFALLLFVVDRTNPLSSPPVVSSVPSQVQDRYQALLFSATKELENDRIYSDSLRRLLRDPHLA